MQIKFQKAKQNSETKLKFGKSKINILRKQDNTQKPKKNFEKAKREKASNKFCKIYTKNVYTKISIKFTKIMVL